MTRAVLMMCAVMMLAASAEGASYSTGFEFADLGAMAAEGWTWSADPSLVTTHAHSGDQAVLLPPRALLERPLGEFGTLNLWVYDEGLIPDSNVAGGRWGLSKNEEVIAGTMFHRSWLNSGVAYGVNSAFNTNLRTGAWYSVTWMDAGDPSARSRGVAGWMNWEIAYYPDGTIEINLLDDPNYPGVPKAFAANTVGVPVEPEISSMDFADEASGGAHAIHLYGSRDTASPFGDLIVDDLTWTPIPEPATLSLLAVGAAALIRRRS